MMRKFSLLWLAICLPLITSCSKKAEEAEEEKAPPPVQVTAVAQENIQRVVFGDGALFPLNQWNVVPKIAAPVERFLVDRGDHVKQGQVVAMLEKRDLQATAAANQGQVAQAQANLRMTERVTIPESDVKAKTDVESAQAAADAAKKLLDSRQKLFQEGALARKLVDEATVAYAQAAAQLSAAQEHLRTLQAAGNQAQLEGARAQVEAAQGQLQSAQAQVGYAEVRSPAAGIVAERPLYPGDVASSSTPLMVIVDISRLVARVNVPVNQAMAIKVGQPATVTVAGTDQQLSGKVTVVSPAADPNAATVQVWVEIPNANERLKPGATVRAGIVTETIRNAATVPSSAILPGEDGGTSVLVVGSDSVAHRHGVEVGVRQGDKVQILSGVAAGDKVVTTGGVGVEDKAKVRIVQPNAPDEDKEDKEDKGEKKGEKGGKGEEEK